MSPLIISALFLTLLSFPPLSSRILGLESGDDRGENLLRWAQFILLCLVDLVVLEGSNGLGQVTAFAVIFILAAGYLEAVLRAVVKFILPVAGRMTPVCAKVHKYLTENPDNLYYSRYVPHPFLQFTGPRGPVPGSDSDFYLGFKELKLSDVSRLPGVVRIACLGGSTTADGYPECLQEYLAAEDSSKRFQVLNFGGMWWSSVHSTVNYVLNVIDFKPDYVVIHDGCNDHHYRGFPGLRGDCAHAYRLFLVRQTVGETLFRFSLSYRICRIVLAWLLPSIFRRSMEMKEVGLMPGKTYNYSPAELYVMERNFKTICTLAREQGSKVILATTPLSVTRSFSEEHDRVYRPHARDVNDIVKRIGLENNLIVVDCDAVMTGHEEYFADAVHSSEAGKKAKAVEIGRAILVDLGLRKA